MMTMREAHQRASVHSCTIQTRFNKRGIREYAARSLNWSNDTFKRRSVWRDDIEDAVLDCGRLS